MPPLFSLSVELLSGTKVVAARPPPPPPPFTPTNGIARQPVGTAARHPPSVSFCRFSFDRLNASAWSDPGAAIDGTFIDPDTTHLQI